ncbi:MAG: MBL fold metallo-hydrolase [Promethearchaeota archaeon]|nr:MAG: MBL fold metallo-hydrolase [Candidatus Lokiarchaeota archaeon]
MKLNFLGGCRQIGGSSVSIRHNNKVYLMDYGVEMEEKPVLPPLNFSIKDLELVFLTHAHLDHSGGIPLLFSGLREPDLLLTPPTKRLCKILYKDMMKLSGYYLPFEYDEIKAALNSANLVKYNPYTWKQAKGIRYLIIDSGHIPGSASIICEINGKRILYTGDVNHRDTMLLNGMVNDFPKLDYVIMESTYGSTDHPPREDVEREFVNAVEDHIKNKNGTVLIPAFGVGRSQECMCILTQYNARYPVFIDGMARKVGRSLMRHLNYLRDGDLYKKAVKRSNFITTGKKKRIERQNALSMPGAIIAPSGMLKGGTAIFYGDHIKDSHNNAIFLVSFQLPNSLGRQVLEENTWKDNKTKINAEVRHFPLSSHSGRTELLSLVDSVSEKSNGNTQFFLMHGDEEQIMDFSNTLSEKGIESIIPNNGEEFEI